MSDNPPPISPTGTAPHGEIWSAIRDASAWRGQNRPALFLDRDGIVNVDSGYVHRLDELEMIAGAADLVRAANDATVAVIVVTNQSGVGRGYYDWAAFSSFQTEIERQLANDGAYIDAAYACPFHGKARPPYDVNEHPARKPGPGMLLAGAQALEIDLATSWIVGDRSGDMLAGAAAGLAGGVLVGAQAAISVPSSFDLRKANNTADVLPLIPLLTP